MKPIIHAASVTIIAGACPAGALARIARSRSRSVPSSRTIHVRMRLR